MNRVKFHLLDALAGGTILTGGYLAANSGAEMKNIQPLPDCAELKGPQVAAPTLQLPPELLAPEAPIPVADPAYAKQLHAVHSAARDMAIGRMEHHARVVGTISGFVNGLAGGVLAPQATCRVASPSEGKLGTEYDKGNSWGYKAGTGILGLSLFSLGLEGAHLLGRRAGQNNGGPGSGGTGGHGGGGGGDERPRHTQLQEARIREQRSRGQNSNRGR